MNYNLLKLRQLMEKQKIDTYIITKCDPHQSEYSSCYWNSVQFMSAFTGSAGTMVVTKTEAGLWTDGRYYTQAQKEIETMGVCLHKAAEPQTKSYINYALDETPVGGKIAFDGRTLSLSQVKELISKSKPKNITINNNLDIVGEIWEDRKHLECTPIFDHDIKYCGKSRGCKIKEVRETMKNKNVKNYIISSLDDIAWLLNLRGGDVENNTTFASYIIIKQEEIVLFVDKDKIKNVKGLLEEENIIIKEYDEIFEYVKSIEKNSNVLVNGNVINYSLYNCLNELEIIEIEVDITTELKAIKNSVEIQNLENVNIRDGVAMVKFIRELKIDIQNEDITEFNIVDRAIKHRASHENYLHQSFDTIAGYNENGAIMHYSPAKEDSLKIKQKGFLLVDSGATYLDGTTDITRTIAMGELTKQMKEDFTLVLKSHIALIGAVFLYGTTGSNIDILARMPMWVNGMDYKSGTGHGIGFCMNVHEGPQRISRGVNPYKLEVGMVITNEPGVYRAGEYGIRTENTMLVKEKMENEAGKFLEFGTISYCPIDINAIDVSMLDSKELQWINNYHHMVYEKLSPCLNEEEKIWLKEQTKEI
jgi:Xaa-Pro aminopeptidase